MVAQTLRLVSSFSKLNLELAFGSKSTTVAISRPDNKQNHCRLGKNVKMRSSTLEEVFY